MQTPPRPSARQVIYNTTRRYHDWDADEDWGGILMLYNIRRAEEKGWPVLMAALNEDWAGLEKIIDEQGVDALITSKSKLGLCGDTSNGIMTAAASFGQTSIVRKLLQLTTAPLGRSADTHLSDRNFGALAEAISHNHVETVKAIIDYMASPEGFEKTGFNGFDYLFNSSNEASKQVVERDGVLHEDYVSIPIHPLLGQNNHEVIKLVLDNIDAVTTAQHEDPVVKVFGCIWKEGLSNPYAHSDLDAKQFALSYMWNHKDYRKRIMAKLPCFMSAGDKPTSEFREWMVQQRMTERVAEEVK